MTTLLAILGGLVVLGLIVARVAIAAERRRRAAAALTARLEALEPAFLPAEQTAGLGLDRRRLPAWLERMLVRADVEPRLDVVAACGFGLVVAGVAAGIFLNPVAAAVVIVGGVALAFVMLRNLGGSRTNALVEALPHFLDAVRQLLMAGYAFQQAFLKAAEDAPAAVRRYLEPAERRIRNGSSTADALTWTAERIDNPELHMVATAVRTNARFGGAIGPILAELSKMLRNRTRVGRELHAATSEVRASGLVLTLLPPAVGVLLVVLDYNYMRMLWETSQGRHMLIVAFVLQAIGMLIMRRLMRIDF